MELRRDFGTVCGCAVRFSLGRQTYMPSLVQQFVIRNLNLIDGYSLAVMVRDVKEHQAMETIQSTNLGG